ncbi:GNAT family N-acetyltransferase [Dactylosporangium sp. NPDC005572]|uniref:GNAT family N-acetyltransferase n=1 Tax=Dactylosporangium sp. NPDC005572 TaxID=3156889 RepID=UPI0033A031F6
MLITPLCVDLIDAVADVMRFGEPYVTVRGPSDYLLYSRLFASTCPVAIDDGAVIGAVIAMRSQDEPDDVHVQDVAIHPAHRRRGVAGALISSVAMQARVWGCHRLWLTCAPGNTTAIATWQRLGFRNLPGSYTIDGIQVIADCKGPGRCHPVFQLDLPAAGPVAQPGTAAGADT